MDLTLHTCSIRNTTAWRKIAFIQIFFPPRSGAVWRSESRKKYCMLNGFRITCNAQRLSVKYIFQSLSPYIKCQELLNYTRSSTQSEQFFTLARLPFLHKHRRADSFVRLSPDSFFFIHKFKFYVKSVSGASAVVWCGGINYNAKRSEHLN